MPKLDDGIQRSCWRLADAVGKALTVSVGGQQGDPQWRVEPLASRAWNITHPELPVVQNEDGVGKEVLLQLHLQPSKETGEWFVVAQNKVMGPQSHASPRALIVAKEKQPPGDSWDFDSIGMAAANFFRLQKEKLVEDSQAAQPRVAPGTGGMIPQPGSGGPMAARRVGSKLLYRDHFIIPDRGGGFHVLSEDGRHVAHKKPLTAALNFIDHSLSPTEPIPRRKGSRRADRIIMLPDGTVRDLARTVLDLKDNGKKKQAEQLAHEVLGNKNLLAETTGTIRRNRVGSRRKAQTGMDATQVYRHPQQTTLNNPPTQPQVNPAAKTQVPAQTQIYRQPNHQQPQRPAQQPPLKTTLNEIIGRFGEQVHQLVDQITQHQPPQNQAVLEYDNPNDWIDPLLYRPQPARYPVRSSKKSARVRYQNKPRRRSRRSGS